jgi:hypothetical protein
LKLSLIIGFLVSPYGIPMIGVVVISFLGFKIYKEWDKKQFEDFIEDYGFSVVEIKLVHGGLAPVGVMIAKKVA